jgi:transcriptional regulator with XRE-family HTH domain
MGWSKRIAELTDRAEVYGLTLASWFGVLPTRALVKPNLSYCLDCLGEWEAAGARLHERLVWSISDVCLTHQRVLETTCSACDRTITGAAVAKGAPGHCPFCTSLLTSSPRPFRAASTEELRVARIAGTLVSRAAHGTSVTPSRIRELAEQAVASVGSAERLAATLTVGPSLVSGWRNSRSTPSFIELVRLAQVAGVELVDFLLGQVRPVADEPMLIARRGQAKGMAWPAVERLINEMLHGPEPKPLSHLIANTGHDRATLKRRYPAETAAIKGRFAAERAQATVDRRADIDRKVGDAVASLRARNIRPSRRALEAELVGLSVREDAVRAAWLKYTT